MGMGGGGSGSGVITAHVHDNNSGQGGPLSDLSLLNTDLLIDVIDRYELLDNYEATSAESSHTFTPSSALEFDTYSQIIVVIDGLTTASLALELIVNGQRGANNYLSVGKRFVWTPTETLIVENSTQYTLATTTCLPSAGSSFNVVVSMTCNDTTTGTNRIHIDTNANCGAINEIKGGINQSVVYTEITEIIVETSTSTWRIGTRMSVYGIKR